MSKSPAGRQILADRRVEFVLGDGRKGWVLEEEGNGKAAKYDAIHVGAAATEVHQELVEQLACPGRIFIPVEGERGNQWIWIVDKDEEGNVSKRRTMGVRYVPLCDAPR